MKKYLLFLVVLISFISCKKQHHDDMNLTMTGTWVETTQGKILLFLEPLVQALYQAKVFT